MRVWHTLPCNTHVYLIAGLTHTYIKLEFTLQSLHIVFLFMLLTFPCDVFVPQLHAPAAVEVI